jgi:hypothetical protein
MSTDTPPTDDLRTRLRAVVDAVMALDIEELELNAVAIDTRRQAEIYKTNRGMSATSGEQINEWARISSILDRLVELQDALELIDDPHNLLDDPRALLADDGGDDE